MPDMVANVNVFLFTLGMESLHLYVCLIDIMLKFDIQSLNPRAVVGVQFRHSAVSVLSDRP